VFAFPPKTSSTSSGQDQRGFSPTFGILSSDIFYIIVDKPPLLLLLKFSTLCPSPGKRNKLTKLLPPCEKAKSLMGDLLEFDN
jgi:hypothetical protein